MGNLYSYLFSVPVQQEIGAKRFANAVAIAVIALSAAAVAVYFALLVQVGVYTLAIVSRRQLEQMGEPLYNHSCQCSNKDIPYRDFMNYKYDLNYDFCLEMPNLYHDNASWIWCNTATYQWQAQLYKENQTFSADTVPSFESIKTTIRNQIQSMTFGIWNQETDGLLISQFLIVNSLEARALAGNVFAFNMVANSSYSIVVVDEYTVKIIAEKILEWTTIDYEKLLDICAPVGCQLLQPTQNYMVLVTAVTFVCSVILPVLRTLGNVAVSVREGYYLDELMAKLRASLVDGNDAGKASKHITQEEIAFLKANSPHFALIINQLMQARRTGSGTLSVAEMRRIYNDSSRTVTIQHHITTADDTQLPPSLSALFSEIEKVPSRESTVELPKIATFHPRQPQIVRFHE